MKISNQQLEFLKAKEATLDKEAGILRNLGLDDIQEMLRLGKSTNKGYNSMLGISRPPITGLKRSIDRSSDLGSVLSDLESLTEKANQGKSSIVNTYKDIFNSSSKTNPLQLLRQARNKAYAPMGASAMHPGASLKQLYNSEIEESIFRSLARQGHNDEIASYAQHLVGTRNDRNSALAGHVKQIAADYAEGKDPVIFIKGGLGNKNLTLTVDRPFASFNGSPVINIKKTMGIDGIESFNKKHITLEQKYQRALTNGNADELHEATAKYRRSLDFNQAFGDDLRLMSSAPDVVNKNKFTLDNLNTIEKVKVFLKNPHLDDSQKLMSDAQRDGISDAIISHVARDPSNIKKGLSEALDHVAKDPNTANYMQGFQFERYSAEDMKKVVETLKGSKKRLVDEYTRAAADAAGALGIGGVIGYGAYKSIVPSDTKMLHNRDERLQYNPTR